MKNFIWGVTWNAWFWPKHWSFCKFSRNVDAIRHNFRVFLAIARSFVVISWFFSFKILKSFGFFHFQNQANFVEFCDTSKFFFSHLKNFFVLCSHWTTIIKHTLTTHTHHHPPNSLCLHTKHLAQLRSTQVQRWNRSKTRYN